MGWNYGLKKITFLLGNICVSIPVKFDKSLISCFLF